MRWVIILLTVCFFMSFLVNSLDEKDQFNRIIISNSSMLVWCISRILDILCNFGLLNAQVLSSYFSINLNIMSFSKVLTILIICFNELYY